MVTSSAPDQDARAEEHGRLIKERRLDLGLNRPSFVAEMARHGQDITPDYLNKLEGGRAPLSRASLPVREALRAVLGFSSEQWQEATGLYVAPTASPHPASAAALGYDVPDTRPEIPEALQEAARLYGDNPAFSDLRLPKWQELLANLPYKNGPRDAQEWLKAFVEAQGKYEPR